MRTLGWITLSGLALTAIMGATWLVTAPRTAFGAADAARLEGGDPEKGKLVFAAGDCASCHASPGQDDRLRLGGGLELASPYGTFRPPNISPDPEDGIGRWSAVDLANALISGVSPAGAHYYPSLPYPSYVHMRTEDVKDLMAYLRSLAPVSGRAPPHDLALPFRVRRFVGFWKMLFLEPRISTDDTMREATLDRGRYLVEAVAHCAECHSTRNVFGAIKPKTRFAGGANPEFVGFAPNITPQRLAHWSRDDIVIVLTSGHTPEGRVVGSTMDSVVANIALLPRSDLEAIAEYLMSLPARRTPRP